MKQITKSDRFLQLCWTLLELKAQYYRPDLVHKSYSRLTVPDAVYDTFEAEYRTLAKELGLNPYTADTVDFPIHSASGRMVAEKLGEPGNMLFFDLLKG